MTTNRFIAITGVLLLSVAAPGALAAVPAEQAARLGDDLTPLGAIRAGNAEGTIPAWRGGLPQAEIPYDTRDYVDPFEDDEIRFTIDAGNMDRYRDKLTPGQIAMMERYPETYRMHVYPTRRSASYPQEVYDAVKRNATRARLVSNIDDLQGATVGPAFPIPQSGAEAIWNHRTKYASTGVEYWYNQAVVNEGGDFSYVRILQNVVLKYARADEPSDLDDNIFLLFTQRVLSPARLAGNVLLVHQTIDQRKQPNLAWVYNPGQRRVRRAPQVGYDNPGAASDGMRTNDQNNLFNGALDRYNWELIGRREMYVPYNSFRLEDRSLEPEDVLQPHHIDQDLARYELHRVWVVEATVREGTRHIYNRRTFYIDEDSWHILAVECYDNRGELWRVQEGHTVNYYEIPAIVSGLETIYDLHSRRYIVSGLDNQEEASDFDWYRPDSYFTPSNLRRLGTR